MYASRITGPTVADSQGVCELFAGNDLSRPGRFADAQVAHHVYQSDRGVGIISAIWVFRAVGGCDTGHLQHASGGRIDVDNKGCGSYRSWRQIVQKTGNDQAGLAAPQTVRKGNH